MRTYIKVSNKIWSWLMLLWVAYCCSVLTVGRHEQLTRWVIWVGVAIAILFTTPFLVRKRKDVPSEALLIAAFIVWSLFGMLHAADIESYIGYLKLVIELMLLIVFFGAVVRNSEAIDSFWCALMIMAVFNILYIPDLGQAVFDAGNTQSRQAGLTGNANALGFFCLLGIMGAMAIFGKVKSYSIRAICTTCGFVALYGIVISGSRGAYIMFPLVAMLWSTVLPHRTRKGYWKTVFAVLIVGCILYVVLQGVQEKNTLLGNRITGTLQGHVFQEKRFDLFRDGTSIIKEHPLFGVGLGQFGLVSGTGLYAHSEWLELMATTGIPGWILFMSVYYSTWRRMSRALPFIQDSTDRYWINMARILLIVLVVGGAIFRPNFTSFDTVFCIAFVVGMGQWAERKRSALTPLKSHTTPVSIHRADARSCRMVRRRRRTLR